MTTQTAPKQFTLADVNRSGPFPRIYADRSELLYAPTKWQEMGLQETASGYGRKLNSGLKIHFEGKLYRIYITCYSNAGTAFFTVRGEQIIVS